MSIKVTDIATGSMPGQHTVRVECSECNKYFDGDYLRSGNERSCRQTVKWIAEQGLDQLITAGCPHAEAADITLPQ